MEQEVVCLEVTGFIHIEHHKDIIQLKWQHTQFNTLNTHERLRHAFCMGLGLVRNSRSTFSLQPITICFTIRAGTDLARTARLTFFTLPENLNLTPPPMNDRTASVLVLNVRFTFRLNPCNPSWVSTVCLNQAPPCKDWLACGGRSLHRYQRFWSLLRFRIWETEYFDAEFVKTGQKS